MSSFQKNKAKKQTCVYCNQPYIPAILQNKGTQCPTCHLWQPHALPHIVKNLVYQKKYNLIQRVFILSLPQDQQRWLTFQKKLSKNTVYPYGKSWNRFKGVNGNDVTEVDKVLTEFFGKPDKENKDKYFEEAQVYRKKVEKYWGAYPGTVGCYLGHLSIWEHIYKTKQNKEEFALVLEDDAHFTPFGIQNMEIALSQATKMKWDILYVGHNKLQGKQIHPLFTRPSGPVNPGHNAGFWGYILRISSIPKILKVMYKFENKGIDDMIRHHFNEISTLFVTPLLIYHDHKPISTRETMNRHRNLLHIKYT